MPCNTPYQTLRRDLIVLKRRKTFLTDQIKEEVGSPQSLERMRAEEAALIRALPVLQKELEELSDHDGQRGTSKKSV